MTKKKAAGGAAVNKAAAKAAKKAKAAAKVERKEKKKVGKGRDEEDDGEDLEAILENMRQEWEAKHKVTEELVEGPPSRRANAVLLADPSGQYLWCIGGEFFSEDDKAYFYNDTFRYNPEKNEWKKYVSPTAPGPRSAHAGVALPAGGGKIFIFGGEFSSPNQRNFFHYRDFWVFDLTTHEWDSIETKKERPSARSGHRMAQWKHYIFLYGGFYDPGFTTKYLDDLWYFDNQEYKWTQVIFRPGASKPSARSGFSFLPHPDGILLHGGYCKEYVKGQRPVGVMLEDTWLLRISVPTPDPDKPEPTTSKKGAKAPEDTLDIKWQRLKRPSTAYAPILRSGCTMALWAARNQGIMFGGVSDEDVNEETMRSVFYNDLNALQLERNRWSSLTLKRPKKAKGKKAAAASQPKKPAEKEAIEKTKEQKGRQRLAAIRLGADPDDLEPDDPIFSTPLPRYNAMLAVLKNTLYIYGGIFEQGTHEYTLDDFYSIVLDKLDRYTCLRESEVVIPEEEDESSDESEGDDDDGSDDDEGSDDEGTIYDDNASTFDIDDNASVISDGDSTLVGGSTRAPSPVEFELDEQAMPAVAEEEDEKVAPVKQKGKVIEEVEEEQEEAMSMPEAVASALKGKLIGEQKPEDANETPLPGETLAMFYHRTREYWSQKAAAGGDVRGKQAKRDGFAKAKERYDEYKPLLHELERVMADAGLNKDEMRAAAKSVGREPQVTSRHRR
ncbi:hypothetical protein EV715DRAFT_290573 [Schizophyllum commune]